MAPSYSERQEQYAAWRDRLRLKDEVIDLDEAPSADDRWDPAALFATSAEIDLTAAESDLDDAGATDQRA